MDDEPTCTFCGAKKSQVGKMVTNDHGAFICDMSELFDQYAWSQS